MASLFQRIYQEEPERQRRARASAELGMEDEGAQAAAGERVMDEERRAVSRAGGPLSGYAALMYEFGVDLPGKSVAYNEAWGRDRNERAWWMHTMQQTPITDSTDNPLMALMMGRYRVGSQRDPLAEPYLVDMRMLSCTCPDSRKMGRTGICKHVRYVGLVRYMLKGVRMPEGAFTHRTGVRNSHISALLGGRVDSQGFPEPQIFFQRMVEADRLACILGDDDTPYTGDLLHTSRFGGNLEFAVFLLSNYFGRNENQRAITINQRLSPLIASLGRVGNNVRYRIPRVSSPTPGWNKRTQTIDMTRKARVVFTYNIVTFGDVFACDCGRYAYETRVCEHMRAFYYLKFIRERGKDFPGIGTNQVLDLLAATAYEEQERISESIQQLSPQVVERIRRNPGMSQQEARRILARLARAREREAERMSKDPYERARWDLYHRRDEVYHTGRFSGWFLGGDVEELGYKPVEESEPVDWQVSGRIDFVDTEQVLQVIPPYTLIAQIPRGRLPREIPS